MADTACFPQATGVPGQPGLPNWWSGTAAFDDPRWVGSYGYSDGAVTFSALLDVESNPTPPPATTKYLVLRWHVNPDPGLAEAGDQVLVGFYNTTTHVATMFQVTRDTADSTDGGTGAMTINAFSRASGGTLWNSVPVPAGVTADARLDVTCVPPTGTSTVCNDWAIRLRVPTAAGSGANGVDLGDTFEMWYEVDVQHGTTPTTTDQSKWPNGAETADLTATPLTVPPPEGSTTPPGSAMWNTVSTVGGSSCSAGIDLEHEDISVANAIGAGTQIDVNSTNTFHVKPLNETATTPYNPDGIKAELRIADWGSAIGDAPLWKVPDPTCQAATGTGAPASITPSTRFDLTCTWTLTAAQKCSFQPTSGCTPDPTLGTRYPHQCILAELASNGGPVTFSPRSSTWNNFDFDHSSKLERKARIAIGNLPPGDVYVYIDAQNLPETVEDVPPSPPPGRQLSATAKQRMGALASLTPGRVSQKDADVLRTLAATGQISYADVAKVMPTYTAYVWHDGGQTVKTKAGPAKLLVEQPSFTLFVSHDGPLRGWRHALTSLGGEAFTEIAPHFYRIHVGNERSVEVLTSIEAIEHAPRPPWLIWLAAALIVLLVVTIIRVARR